MRLARTTNFLTQGRALLEYEMPMAEMIRDFFAVSRPEWLVRVRLRS